MKVWQYQSQQHQFEPWKKQESLWESLGQCLGLFPCPYVWNLPPHLAVSLVGGGGKTSVMYQLAMELAAAGKRVIVTTSTNLASPEFPNQEFPGRNQAFPVIVKEDQSADEFLQALTRQLEQHSMIMAGGQELWRADQTGEQIHKIKGLPIEVLDAMKFLCDVLLIEADGARRLPFKVPAEHEPVISAQTDLVIGCMGLDCIGRPWKEMCFRWELAESVQRGDTGRTLPKPQTARKSLADQEPPMITPKAAAEVLGASWGTKKGVQNRPFAVVLNKADDELRRNTAKEIGRLLGEKKIPCVMTCFHDSGDCLSSQKSSM